MTLFTNQKPARLLATVWAVSALAFGVWAQENGCIDCVDDSDDADMAYVPIIVNVAASVKAERVGSVSGAVITHVEAMAEDTLKIPLTKGTGTAFGARRQSSAALIFGNRAGKVTINLPVQSYGNMEISLYSVNGKRVSRNRVSAASAGSRLIRRNVAAGAYVLSVKGTAVSAVSRLTHRGGNLDISVIFGGGSASSASRLPKKAADGDAYILSASATGYHDTSYTFYPEAGINPKQNIILKSVDAAILLKGTTAEYTGTGTNVAVVQSAVYGTIVEISGSGAYLVQGPLNQGFIAVTKKDLDVTLILDGVDITCGNYAAIASLKKSDVTIALAENSVNKLTDGGAGADADGKYAYEYDGEEAPNAALFVRKNLTIKGPGKLIVTGGANNGIGSRANLVIEGGDITVTAKNNAIKGNDSIAVSGGKFNLTSTGGDGIKTDEGSAAEGMGNISISGGEFAITALHDAVESEGSLTISGASFTIKTGGGSTTASASAHTAASVAKAKGLKAATDIVINSGTFNINSKDDAVHSNKTVIINGGTFDIKTDDDGIHADSTLTVNGGTINIGLCYEGLESYNINLNGGFAKIKSVDDGINVSAGSSGTTTTLGAGGGGGRPGQGGGGGGETVISGKLSITGGEYFVESASDGLDSNGNIEMSGGTVVVNGPNSGQEVPIDYNGAFKMAGGTLVATGYYGGNMAQQPGSTSTQYTFMAKNISAAAGSLINVSSATGTEIVTVRVTKAASGIVVCSPLLERGTYNIYSGGSHSGTINELGLFTGGSYSGGTLAKTFTISGIVTTVN